MSVIVPAVMLRRALAFASDAAGLDGPLHEPTLHLFKNDYTPTPASVAADFEEADFTGYSGEPLLQKLGVAIESAGQVARIIYATHAWFLTDTTVTGVAWGWYLTHFGDNTLVAAERFPAAKQMVAVGNYVQVTPTIPWKNMGV